jgi:hypothetical protein
MGKSKDMWARSLIAVLLVAVMFATATTSRPTTARAANAIVTENLLPGSNAWQIGALQATDLGGQIKGYASATSVSQNQGITLYVTVTPAQTYNIDFYRLGWYNGAGGRLRLHVGPLAGTPQQACLPDSTTGLIACNWSASYGLTVPSDWTSGVYVALLTNAAGYQNYIIFLVKDGRPAPLLYQQSVMTYEAYNNYPNDNLTGKSLYAYNSYGAPTVGGNARAVKVSFDRPYTFDGAGQYFSFEVDFVRWMERSGYDVTYSTDMDTHANGAALKNSRAFLSVAHDEYWSKEMFDAVQSARDAGVNLAFFGSDADFWQIRMESSAAGAANRVMVCYKDGSIDPVQGPMTTVNWRSAPVNRPEQALMGVQFTSQVNWGSNVAYVVTNSSNWVYNGTGFKDGDTVPGIVGYEMDRFMSNFTGPLPSQVILSRSPYTDGSGLPDYANSSIYRAAGGAWVFAAGTMSWSHALDNYTNTNLVDARIQKTTANILDAFVTVTVPVATSLKVTAPATVTAGQPFSVTVVAVDASGTPVTSYNGTVHFTSSDTAAGVMLPADSTLTNGQGTFSVTLVKAGSQTVTATDTANSTITGMATVQVNAAAAASLTIAAPATATANQPVSVTVSLADRFGNAATGYTGSVHFWSNDVAATLPPDYTFTAGDAGRHTFSVTFRTPSSEIFPTYISATDNANPNLTQTNNGTVVSAAIAPVAPAAPATLPILPIH